MKETYGRRRSNLFDNLPEEIVISILCKLSSSALSPSDFINVLISCKRLCRLGLHPLVLSKAGLNTLSVKAENWSEQAHRFLKLCVSAGNIEASYILGMIRFYCLQKRGSGTSLMAKAAMKSHAHALYSLAVIQFNGSGASKNKKDLRAGVALCARAAYLGNIDALRELGHCLQDGYGVSQSLLHGRRLLVQANAKELASVLRCNRSSSLNPPVSTGLEGESRSSLKWALWSDYGCNVPEDEVHPVNTFLVEWFKLKEDGPGHDLRICSYSRCGRPETRRSEFRRCSRCGKTHYCSRGCQAHDWKMRHRTECEHLELWWMEREAEDGGDDDEEERAGDNPMVEIDQQTEEERMAVR